MQWETHFAPSAFDKMIIFLRRGVGKRSQSDDIIREMIDICWEMNDIYSKMIDIFREMNDICREMIDINTTYQNKGLPTTGKSFFTH